MKHVGKGRLPARWIGLGLFLLLAAGLLLERRDDNCNGTPTEQEFIDNAVEYFLTLQFESAFRKNADGNIVAVPFKIYSDLANFYAVSPNCCTFSYRGQDGYLPSLLYQMRHDYKGTVIIRHPILREITDDGLILHNTINRSVRMNGCAQPIITENEG
jgi:hypothetical protein